MICHARLSRLGKSSCFMWYRGNTKLLGKFQIITSSDQVDPRFFPPVVFRLVIIPIMICPQLFFHFMFAQLIIVTQVYSSSTINISFQVRYPDSSIGGFDDNHTQHVPFHQHHIAACLLHDHNPKLKNGLVLDQQLL